MKYRINKRCFRKISSFYHNVARKYKHTYSEELMHKNIDEAIDSMYQIESTLLRREPTVFGWKGFHMANTDKWYFSPIRLKMTLLPLLMQTIPKTCIIPQGRKTSNITQFKDYPPNHSRHIRLLSSNQSSIASSNVHLKG